MRRLSALIGSWLLYWLLLIIIKLGPAIAAVTPVVNRGKDTHGSINFNYGDEGFVLEVVEQGTTLYRGVTGFLPLVLWICVPPLILWIIWIVLRRRSSEPSLAQGEIR